MTVSVTLLYYDSFTPRVYLKGPRDGHSQHTKKTCQTIGVGIPLPRQGWSFARKFVKQWSELPPSPVAHLPDAQFHGDPTMDDRQLCAVVEALLQVTSSSWGPVDRKKSGRLVSRP